MSNYAYIINDRVNQVLHTSTMRLEDMYSKEIVDNCIKCDDTVKEGMDYNSETGEFTEHIEPVIEENVEEVVEDGDEGI